MWAHVDQAEGFLRKEFGNKLDFHTAVDTEKCNVTLKVYEKLPPQGVRSENLGPGKLLWEVTEPVESFVSPTTLTKIILIAG